MEKVKEYMSISVYGTKELNEKVNEAIKNGFTPIGGVASCHIKIDGTLRGISGGGLMLTQAMVKI